MCGWRVVLHGSESENTKIYIDDLYWTKFHHTHTPYAANVQSWLCEIQLSNDGEEINKQHSCQSRKGVGKIMFLSRCTRSDICNSVRDLARRMSKPTMSHYKAMLRVMEYVDNTKEMG